VTVLETGELDSPLGPLRFARGPAGLHALGFAELWSPLARALERRLGAVAWIDARDARELAARLDGYFAGDLTTLDGVEVALAGSDFQRRVWTALRAIPAGTTTTYAALARAIGAPSAARAVGAANGANPLWLVVPCHRAIGSDGSLVGYAGGLERKRWLLAHEAQRAVQNSEKRPQSSGPSGAEPAFVPAGTATGLPPSKRWSTMPSKSVSSSWRVS
jgi:methylated-DNA-[protein]-cysteine S-methyltransferase